MSARRIASGIVYSVMSILTLACLFGGDPDDNGVYPASQVPRQ